MKRIIIVTLLISVGASAFGQNADEIFRQKKTQRKYLIKQIALLRVYLGYVKKGYDIAQKGLAVIHHIKDGEFQLHDAFFASLKNVNPHIAGSARVAAILSGQVALAKQVANLKHRYSSDEYLSADEILYLTKVCHNMLLHLNESAAELLVIIRSGQSEMEDNERIARIDRLYAEMLDQHAYLGSLSSEVEFLVLARAKEHSSNEWTGLQYGL